jgi:hypothetical protein
MVLPIKLKALAGVGGVVAAIALTAVPSYAVTPTGSEAILTPESVGAGVTVSTTSYTPPVDAAGNPTPATDVTISLSGTGYVEGQSIQIMICDGKSPSAAGYQPTMDCDSGTAVSGVPVLNSAGSWTYTASLAGQNWLGVFRGDSPQDLFNCLAPQDNPNGTETVSGNPIDPANPSWGASTVGTSGGGTAGCNIRIAYSNQTVSTTSDKYIPLALPNTASTPPTNVPESPLAIALPIGGVVLFGAAGAVLYRKRRSVSAS